MILTILTIENDNFTLEFDPEKTVAELKQEIYDFCGPDYMVEKQKLVYAGVYMENERKLTSYEVIETKFIVVMLSDYTVENPVDMQTLEEGAISAASAGQELPFENVEESIGESTNADGNFLMADEYNRLVENIVEMGYDRERVEQAMAESYNHPERAVEYLVNGFPSMEDAVMVEAPMESLSAASNTDETLSACHTEENEYSANGFPTVKDTASNTDEILDADDTEANDEDPFGFLREHPRFSDLRSMILAHPELVEPVLHQIEEGNPILFQLIVENREAFDRMLFGEADNENQQAVVIDAEPPEGAEITEISDSENYDVEEQRVDAAGPSTMEQDHNLQDDEEDCQVYLTHEDQSAIDRLKALGFSKALVTQAYFACDKNEQLAANFLISSDFD